MTEHATVYASGSLLTPGVLQELFTGPARGEFAPGTFTTLAGDQVESLNETLEAGFDLLCGLYDRIRDDLPKMDVSALRERWVLPLLSLLDWTPKYQKAHLKPHPLDEATFAISHLGWDDSSAPPVHVETSGNAELGLDARPQPRKPSPHDLVQNFLNLAEQDWGIVTDGKELRVLRDYHSSSAKGFVAVELENLFESRDFGAFQALYRLAHVSRFLPMDPEDSESRTPLQSLYERSQAAGISVGRALHPQVRKAIETLANGVVKQDPSLKDQLADAEVARSFYGEVLRIVYRLLFLFFAEQRGMLPGRDTLYAETYSVTRLRDLAEHAGEVEGRRTDLYEGLKVTFRLMSMGSDSLEVKAFNGHLFDLSETPVMTAGSMTNRDLLRAIRALTSVEVEGQRQHVAYGTIGVEELGAVYESLLDYTPRIATSVVVSDAGETVPAGSLYLERIGDRELGSYYTPPDLVAFTLELSLEKLIEERLAGLDDPHEQENALLDIRAVDPACGSGAFLVAVIDRLASRLIEVRLAGAQPTEQQLAEARRDVLQNCIYGVDVDSFAVELCKVALWIHCSVADLPLTFLDHRIQCGNSLIGWPLKDIPAEIPADAYQTKGKTKGDKQTKIVCDSARQRNKKSLEGQGSLFTGAVASPDIRLDYPTLWMQEEKTPADVEKKTVTYNEYLGSTAYRLWNRAADEWSASFFWTADYGNFAPISTDYWSAREIAEKYRDGALLDEGVEEHLTSPVGSASEKMGDTLNFFHWPLRFPEVTERGGFDLVVGNPPWEVVKLEEREWFATRDARIAAATSAGRKTLIEALDEVNPELAREWRTASAAVVRQAEYMRHSGRYARSGNEPNTYLLFTETNSQIVRANGRAAFIVKSSLGIDKGGQPVFQPLVQSGRIEAFYDIVNGGRGQTVIFPGVAEVERFTVLVLGPAGGAADLSASMMNWSIEEARARKMMTASSAALKTMNPVTRSLPSFREREQWEIALAIQERHATLDFDQPTATELASGVRSEPTNPWGLVYATLFHSSGDAEHYLKREDLEADDWTLGDDMIFRRGKGEALPLYEGQLVNRYDHRARTYAGYPIEKKYGKKPGIPLTSDEQKANPRYEIEPRYWMVKETADQRFDVTVGDRALIGIRNVGAPWTNRRTARGALMARRPATHALPILAVGQGPFEFAAIFNSCVFDFLLRGKMPSGNAAMVWVLSQVAAPAAGLDARIEQNARKLSLTSHAIAREFDADPHPWDPDERYALDVETDALVTHAYGITEGEYAVILDTFHVLARKEIAEHGSYKFKEDCLAAYRRVG